VSANVGSAGSVKLKRALHHVPLQFVAVRIAQYHVPGVNPVSVVVTGRGIDAQPHQSQNQLTVIQPGGFGDVAVLQPLPGVPYLNVYVVTPHAHGATVPCNVIQLLTTVGETFSVRRVELG
jgi:hypothetical protein